VMLREFAIRKSHHRYMDIGTLDKPHKLAAADCT